MTTPWFGWEIATMQFCEENVEGLIAQPANTWTNGVAIIIGMWMLFFYYRKDSRFDLIMLPVSAILVGLTSGLYHASYTFFFQVFDLASMYLLSAFLLAYNIIRLKPTWKRGTFPLYVGIFILQLILLLLIRQRSGAIIFAAAILLSMGIEFVLSRRQKVVYREYFIALGAFALAFVVWTLDILRIWNDPTNHFINGHALWHIINAFCFIFLYRFYRQFPE